MDRKFTEEVQAWLQEDASKRDYAKGATYLLQLSNNQIMYRNLIRNPAAKAEFIEYQIRKYMKFRLADLTHEQVQEMQQQVNRIARTHALDKEPTAPKDKATEFRHGKRGDHDSLPPEIQALYVENASIMQKMRELHLRLRTLSTANVTCPDSERYPFLKELIALDKQYHHNWQVYDSWSAAKAAEGAEQTLIEDERQQQKNIYRQINLTKGRFKKNPSEALKEQIASLYSQLSAPVETLTAELISLGIIDNPAE